MRATTANCAHCSAPFAVAPLGRPRKFCSDDCRRAHHRAVGHCVDCGVEVSSNARTKLPKRCAGCSARARSEFFASGEFKAKRDLVASLYLSGKPLTEIAEELDTTVRVVAITIHRLRHHYGYDLPYRYTMGADGRRLPDEVAA